MTPEEELRNELRRRVPETEILFEESSDPYFRALNDRYPFSGSKIDWARVPRMKERDVDITAEAYIDEALAFTKEVLASERLDERSPVIVVDDGTIDPALRMSLSTFVVCLPDILGWFHHTYVMPSDASWVLVYTMEGNLNFGYAPS